MIVERVTPGTEGWERYSADHVQRYSFFKDYYQGKDVLDVACGAGYGSAMMLENGAKSVTGMDISEEAIDFCKKNYSRPNLTYLKGDCHHLEQLQKKFDVVISFETIEHLADPEKFIQSAHNVLSENGAFICSTPNKDRFSDLGFTENPFHIHELYFDEFKILFEKYFTIEKSYHQSESISFFRYQELRNLIHQLDRQMQSYIFVRVENFLRKLINRPFRPWKFYNDELEYFYGDDFVIESLEKLKKWHKTYILAGKVKK